MRRRIERERAPLLEYLLLILLVAIAAIAGMTLLGNSDKPAPSQPGQHPSHPGRSQLLSAADPSGLGFVVQSGSTCTRV